jgi:hypothetical protein
MSVSYTYKLYDGDTFLATIPARLIISDFEYSQDINSASAQTIVEVGMTLEDTGATTANTRIIAGAGQYITTTSGNKIISERAYAFPDLPISLANRIVITKYYAEAVNGVTCFDGLITSFKSGYRSNTIKLYCVSHGIKLDNYLIETVAGTAAVYDTTSDTERELDLVVSSPVYFRQLGQTLQTISPAIFTSVKLKVRTTGSITLNVALRDGEADFGGGTYWGTAAQTINVATQTEYELTFDFPVTIPAATTYNLRIWRSDSNTGVQAWLGADSTGGFIGGSLSTYDGNLWSLTSTDIYFKLITSSGGGGIGGNFLSYEVADIAKVLLNSFADRGGLVTYTDDSIQTTGVTASYNFTFDTLLDGLNVVRKLAPSNWYWYVDIGSNVFYLKAQGTTPDHTLVLGKHIYDAEFEYTLDDVRNSVYFSGGDTGGGSNLLTVNENTASQGKYGVWLDKPSDARVTLTATADLISQGTIQANSEPVFRTTVSVPAGVYDIESFVQGQMVAFAGFNDFINDQLLQIVGLDKVSNLITLHLATLPPRINHRIEDIKRNLDVLATVNNPSTPT